VYHRQIFPDAEYARRNPDSTGTSMLDRLHAEHEQREAGASAAETTAEEDEYVETPLE
jgi:hypothetical protein